MPCIHHCLRQGLPLALAGLIAPASQAALVSVDFGLTGFSAPFAEHSSLATDGALSTWQGGRVTWVVGDMPVAPIDLPLAGGIQPWTLTSPTGIQHSAILEHELAAPDGAHGVVFADRYGWRTLDGNYFYPAWDVSASRDNFLVFQPAAPQEVAVGDVFRLGTFLLRNGSWHSASNGSEPVQIDFRITLRSSDAWFDGLTVSDTFVYQALVAPGGTVLENADAFWLVGRPDLGAARVLEQGIGSFDLYARIGSLTLESFADATGDVILTPTIGPIPEAPTAAMLALGALVMAWRRRDSTWR